MGADGDFSLDTTTTTLYGPKAAGTWPAAGVTSLVAGTCPVSVSVALLQNSSQPSYGYLADNGLEIPVTEVLFANINPSPATAIIHVSAGDVVAIELAGAYGAVKFSPNGTPSASMVIAELAAG